MLALWIGLPLVARLLLLLMLGLAMGGAVNHAIYTWCWYPRPFSPWLRSETPGSASRLLRRIPVLGWIVRRRESTRHGRGFWIRPVLIELALGAAIPLLYWYECVAMGLLPDAARIPAVAAANTIWFHRVFVQHAWLLVLMTAATFIDFDEQTIPDAITIPGTLLALSSGAISAWGFMPYLTTKGFQPITYDVPWPLRAGWFGASGLLVALIIWSGWCFALADRRLILRRGLRKGAEFFFAGLVRSGSWKVLLSMWLFGVIGIAAVWKWAPLAVNGPWHGLLTALMGAAVGGGTVWAVRIVAFVAMRVEAMGFGDVTLMSMIGATLGWQASLSAFFLAPIAAILIVLVQFVVTREPRVPFGPYLCAGAALTVVFWDPICNGWLLPNLFLVGPLMLWLCLAMLGLMGALLFVWRVVKETFLYD